MSLPPYTALCPPTTDRYFRFQINFIFSLYSELEVRLLPGMCSKSTYSSGKGSVIIETQPPRPRTLSKQVNNNRPKYDSFSLYCAPKASLILFKPMMCTFYARKKLLLSARLSHRNSVSLSVPLSVRPFVTRVDQSKTVQAGITKSSPSAAWKTLVSRTVKLFHKCEGGYSERGR